MHLVKDIGISPWPVGWLNSVQMRMPTGSRWVSNNYITRCHRRLESVSLSCSLSSSCSQLGTRCPCESQLQTEGLGPQWPTVEQPSQDAKEMLLWSEEPWVNMLQSVPVSNSPLTHNQHQPFRIKCERYIFIKKCVHSFIKVRHYCWLCFRLYLYMYCVVGCGHTTHR